MGTDVRAQRGTAPDWPTLAWRIDMADHTCSVEGCAGVVVARGWCGRHYMRVSRYGDPGVVYRPYQHMGTPESRFWAKVDKDGPVPACAPELGPCWIWTACRIRSDYGSLSLGRRRTLAHRAAYQFLVGPVPEGLELDHLCRTPACVKAVADEHGPAHLEAVTKSQNIRRGLGPQILGDRNRLKTHCPQGHPYAGDNLYVYDGKTHRSRMCRACMAAHSRRRGATRGE